MIKGGPSSSMLQMWFFCSEPLSPEKSKHPAQTCKVGEKEASKPMFGSSLFVKNVMEDFQSCHTFGTGLCGVQADLGWPPTYIAEHCRRILSKFTKTSDGNKWTRLCTGSLFKAVWFESLKPHNLSRKIEPKCPLSWTSILTIRLSFQNQTR